MVLYHRPGDTVRIITSGGKAKPARIETSTATNSSLTVSLGSGAASTVTKQASPGSVKRKFS